jgi:hypothetical protein
MGIYNVHGFVISVEGPADRVFAREYGYFKVSEVPRRVDLFVKVNERHDSLPTMVWGCNKGMFIPFGENENTLWYDEGVELIKEYLIHFCEFLMRWPDKTWLHAGAVEKNGKAYVFTGEGGVGKTSLVLNLVRAGYNYLSDDFLIINNVGVAFPFPRRVHIFDYNLNDGEIAKRILGSKRLYYIPICKLINVGVKLSPNRYVKYAFEKLREWTMLRIELSKLYPNCKIASPTPISKIFFLKREKIENVRVEKFSHDIKEFIRRIIFINMYEWGNCLREYYRYVCRFGINNWRIENKIQHDMNIFYDAFKKAEIYMMTIPENFNLLKVDLSSLLNLE